jgi:hypothetical protein
MTGVLVCVCVCARARACVLCVLCVCFCFRLVGSIHLRHMPSLPRAFRLDRRERYLYVCSGLLRRWGFEL